MDFNALMNWCFIILIFVAGFFINYLRTRNDIIADAAKWIADAEEQYKNTENAGKMKMQYCIQKLRNYVPAYLAVIITDDMIEQIVQGTFEYVRDFATLRLDTVMRSPMR